MDTAILPLEIIVEHIARERPCVFNAFSRACKILHNTLKIHVEYLEKLWLRCYQFEKSTINTLSSKYVVIKHVNPCGNLHGEFSIHLKGEQTHPVFIGHFKNGRQHGRFVKYHNGNIVSDSTYNNGVLQGPYMAYDYSQSKVYFVKCNYVNGKRHGLYVKKQGLRPVHVCYYNKGIQCGIERTWWDDGRKKTECKYEQGRKHGWYYEYDNRGTITESTLYRHGKKIMIFHHEISEIMAAMEPYPPANFREYDL